MPVMSDLCTREPKIAPARAIEAKACTRGHTTSLNYRTPAFLPHQVAGCVLAIGSADELHFRAEPERTREGGLERADVVPRQPWDVQQLACAEDGLPARRTREERMGAQVGRVEVDERVVAQRAAVRVHAAALACVVDAHVLGADDLREHASAGGSRSGDRPLGLPNGCHGPFGKPCGGLAGTAAVLPSRPTCASTLWYGSLWSGETVPCGRGEHQNISVLALAVSARPYSGISVPFNSFMRM
jgi:hypothetical protein